MYKGEILTFFDKTLVILCKCFFSFFTPEIRIFRVCELKLKYIWIDSFCASHQYI